MHKLATPNIHKTTYLEMPPYLDKALSLMQAHMNQGGGEKEEKALERRRGRRRVRLRDVPITSFV